MAERNELHVIVNSGLIDTNILGADIYSATDKHFETILLWKLRKWRTHREPNAGAKRSGTHID